MNRRTEGSRIDSSKVLTIYFSHSGNTQKVAEQIHEQMGGDIVEILTVAPYPTDYNAVVEQAKQELKSGYKPTLKTTIKKIDSYDVIFVGSPNWWSTFAPPVTTFLSEIALSGKTILPFITHEGTGLGQSLRDIAKLCPNSTVLDGLAVRGGSANNAQQDVLLWLRKLGMHE